MFRAARWKLTGGYAGALSLILLIVGVATFFVVRNALDHDITTSIEASLQELERYDPTRFNPSYHVGPGRGQGDPGDLPPVRDPEGDDRASTILSSDVFYFVATSDGTVVSNPRRINVEGIAIESLVSDAEADNHWQDVSGDSGSYRLATYATADSPAGTLYLLVGKSLDARDRNLNTLIQTLLIAGSVGLILSVGGGWWLAGRALSPIEESLESQRRFVSDASHELRTPVAVVRANNELLQLHPNQRIGDNLEQVEAIASEAEHMSRLVDDLLTLARADEGRLALQKDLVDLGEIAGAVARQMSAVAEKRGISIDNACEIALVEGDEGRLRQLVLILVDNAVKYSPDGANVRVACRKVGRNIELSVQDNGRGIAEEDLPHVFDRFFRANTARTQNEAGGLGLGLAIAHEIVQAHGGRITVESKQGDGTTFCVRMKAATA